MKSHITIGLIIATAIIGLSLGDALTGHGIRGNKNLNSMVVGGGSTSADSTSTTTTNAGGEDGGVTTSEEEVKGCKQNASAHYSGGYKGKDGKQHFTQVELTLTCPAGDEKDCKTGVVTHAIDENDN